VPVIALCGNSEVPGEVLLEQGFKEVLVVSDPEKPLSYNMEQAAVLIRESVRDYFRDLPEARDH
jgi:hypothetical protein